MLQSPADPLRKAAKLLRAGKKKDALKLLLDIVDINPESEQAWYMLSFAVDDREQGRDILEKVLKLNPENAQAKARLARLSEPAPKIKKAPAAKSTQPDEPSVLSVPGLGQPPRQLPRRALLGGAAAAVIIICIVLLIFAVSRINQSQQAADLLTPAVDAQPVESGSAVLPPTWTPFPTPAGTATRTPASLPTPNTPAPQALAEMRDIQREVADLRGLEIRGEIDHFVVTNAYVRDKLLNELFDFAPEASLQDEVYVLSALGLVEPTYNYVDAIINDVVSSVGGFYLPWTQELFIVGNKFNGLEHYIYSHEYDHVLIDQHFDIAAMGLYPLCQGDRQRCQAIRALVEGDAVLAMEQWLDQYSSPLDRLDISNYQYDPLNRELLEQFPVPYRSQNANFPYVFGLEFVRYLYSTGNWAAVDRAYVDLPESTEQILHPPKYLAGEQPTILAPPDLSDVVSAEWRLLDQNVLGEWMTYLILAYGIDPDAQLDGFLASIAAEGWGGDNYQVYYNDTSGQTLLAVQWVWDTPADAQEFSETMRIYQDKRFQGGSLNISSGDCREASAQISCTFLKESETLWIIAPDALFINSVLALYPNFP